MAMPLRQLLRVLLVASLGLAHAEDFPEGSVVRAAEPTEHDKNNPLFKVSTGKLGECGSPRARGREGGQGRTRVPR